MKKQKYYVVWVGRHPGVYDDWNDALEQVEEFPNARYKSFRTSQEAVEAFRKEMKKEEAAEIAGLLAGASEHSSDRPKEEKRFAVPDGAVQRDYLKFPEIDTDGWAVDASCLGNPGRMEYRCVDLKTGREVFRMGPFEQGTNNIGEFLAIVHALALMYRNNDWHTLYSDSRIAIGWVMRRQPKTTLVMNDTTRRLYELLGRAVIWLRSHSWPVRLLKWDSERWGEIPADFDRK